MQRLAAVLALIAAATALPVRAYDPERPVYADKTDARSLTSYASRLVQDDLGTAAIPFLETAIEEDPSYADAYVWLGLAYAAEGRADKATECYQRYLALSPDGERRGEMEKALNGLRTAEKPVARRPSKPAKPEKSLARN